MPPVLEDPYPSVTIHVRSLADGSRGPYADIRTEYLDVLSALYHTSDRADSDDGSKKSLCGIRFDLSGESDGGLEPYQAKFVWADSDNFLDIIGSMSGSYASGANPDMSGLIGPAVVKRAAPNEGKGIVRPVFVNPLGADEMEKIFGSARIPLVVRPEDGARLTNFPEGFPDVIDREATVEATALWKNAEDNRREKNKAAGIAECIQLGLDPSEYYDMD